MPHPLVVPRRPVRAVRRPDDVARASLAALLTPEHVAIDVDALRRGEPCDPFDALVDTRAARASWTVGFRTLTERVARHAKARIRRRLIDRLREAVTAAGGVWIRLAPFPYPYRSAFSFRADLDEPVADDYHRFAAARTPLADCCTHFVSTHAYAHHPSVLRDLKDHDTQSHGHFHHVYRDPEANRVNLERAHRILGSFGFEPTGFAAPHGRWSAGLDDALEDFGYLYSSDFQLGYDDFPFFPWKGDRFSRVLQIPVHPVCEGLFLEAGVADGQAIGEYLARSSPRGSTRASWPSSTAIPSAGWAGCPRSCGRSPGRSNRSRWSGERRSPSWRDGGAGGPSGGGWSSPARIIAWRSSSTSGTPSTTSPWRSTAATSSARCP